MYEKMQSLVAHITFRLKGVRQIYFLGRGCRRDQRQQDREAGGWSMPGRSTTLSGRAVFIHPSATQPSNIQEYFRERSV